MVNVNVQRTHRQKMQHEAYLNRKTKRGYYSKLLLGQNLYLKMCRRKRRKEILDILGHKCFNPNCPIPIDKIIDSDLQIDHINGGGRKDQKYNGANDKMYKRILDEIKKGSKDYQILCSFCNWRKRNINGEQ